MGAAGSTSTAAWEIRPSSRRNLSTWLPGERRRGAGGTSTSQKTYRFSVGPGAASVDAARHHVLVPVASRAGVGKAADKLRGVKLLEAFHVLG